MDDVAQLDGVAAGYVDGMRWPKWIRDTTESANRAGELNRKGGPRLHHGTHELFPRMRAAPLHRRADLEPQPLDSAPDVAKRQPRD